MSTMDAPVVPMSEASTAPSARSPVFSPGVPASVPRTTIPPEMMNSAPSRMMNAAYSCALWSTAVCIEDAHPQHHRRAEQETHERLVAVSLPEVGRGEGQDRDGEEHQAEWADAPERHPVP